MPKGGDKTMFKEIIENVHVNDRNKPSKYQYSQTMPQQYFHSPPLP